MLAYFLCARLFVTLDKLLSLGNIQINLAFRSFIRNFAAYLEIILN